MKKIGTAWVGILLCAITSACRDVRDDLDAGQRQVAPVVDALQGYRNDKGLYPLELSELVAAGYVKHLPVLKRQRGSQKAPSLQHCR